MEDNSSKYKFSDPSISFLNCLDELSQNLPNKTIEKQGSNMNIELNITSNIFIEDKNICPYLWVGENPEIPKIKLLN